MTEPLQIAAAVAGLISLASDLTQVCYGYYRKAKNAPDAVQDVILEVKLLRKALSDLEDICGRRTFGLKIDNDFRKPHRLLKRLEWPFRDPEIRMFLSQIQSYRAVFESAKTNAILEVVLDVHNDLKSEAARQDAVRKAERRRVILDWLSPLDFRDQQQEYYDIRRQPGTSEWVENEPSFIQWRDGPVVCDSPEQALWCTGSPGSGKTICCSVLIHRLSLMSGRTVLAFAYFSIQKRGVMTPENIVGSLIKQIISSDVKDGMLPRFIEDYYDTNVGIARPSLVGLSSLLAMASRSFSRVFIVVDGVDELEEETQKVMIRLSKLFFRQNSARLLVSSRPHMPRLSRYLFPAFSLKITGQDTDIRKFVKSRIMEDFKLRMIIGGDHSLADKIARDIAVRSQGQFTIAEMHLRKISEATNKAALLNLEYLPTTLQQYYEEGVGRMKHQPASHFELARKSFGLMCQAKDLLTTEELQEGICIAKGDRNLDESRLTPFPIILSACLGFVSNDNPSKIVEFFHATFQEWLLANSELWSEPKLDIGEVCLTYLMLEDFTEPCKTQDLLVTRRQRYPFAAYASRYWADHMQGDIESNLQEPLLRFLASSNLISSIQIVPEGASRDTRLIGKSSEWLDIAESNNVVALYFCVRFHLQRIFDAMLQREFEPPLIVPWGRKDSPLHAALRLRDGELSRKLIVKGVWTNVQDVCGMTPLHLALALGGSLLTSMALRLMADAKAMIDIPDCHGRTAFHYAIRTNNRSALNYMLENYAALIPSSWNIQKYSPFHETFQGRATSWMVKPLLKNKFSPMIPNAEGKTALAVAIERGTRAAGLCVKNVLEAADAPDATFKIPAHERKAADAFLKALAKQDLDEKASIEEQQTRFGEGRLGELETACERGDIRRLVSLLLQGAIINKIDPASGMTPLHHAVLQNQQEATWHLLAAGADPSLRDTKAQVSARTLAERAGLQSIIARLLSDEQAWMEMEMLVGEGALERKISGRELREVYEHGRRVLLLLLPKHDVGSSLAYRSTNWFEYLGFGKWSAALPAR